MSKDKTDKDKPDKKKKSAPKKAAPGKTDAPKVVNVPGDVNKQKTNPETGLTDQQEQFCREYLMPDPKSGKPFNGTQAAIRAGYAPKAARQQASRLLSNVNVQAYLSVLQAPSIKKFEVTQERIMEEVARVAFSNLFDFVTVDDNGYAYINLSDITREQAAALAQIEVIELPPHGEEEREVLKVKIKMWDKLNALEKLMKRHGLLKEQIEVSGKVELTSTELARRMAFMLRSAAERRTPK